MCTCNHTPKKSTCRLRLGVSHLLLLFTTIICKYSRIYNSVSQKFTVKKEQDGEMHRSKIAVCIPIVTLMTVMSSSPKEVGRVFFF